MVAEHIPILMEGDTRVAIVMTYAKEEEKKLLVLLSTRVTSRTIRNMEEEFTSITTVMCLMETLKMAASMDRTACIRGQIAVHSRDRFRTIRCVRGCTPTIAIAFQGRLSMAA